MMDADYEVTSELDGMLGSSLAERLQAHTILASTCEETTNECTAYIREVMSPLTRQLCSPALGTFTSAHDV